MAKKCKKCGKFDVVPGTTYCTKCKMLVLKELNEVGYLEPAPKQKGRKTRAKRDDIEAAWGWAA